MADETLDVELNEVVKDAFYPALKTQLTKHLGESDSTLFEYIVLLISNKRTKTHIINDLQAFFQDSAKEFTQWLWEFLKPFEKSEGGSVMSALADGEEENAAESDKRSRSSRKDENNDKKTSRRDSPKEKDRSDQRSEKRTERSERDRRRSASPKEKRTKPSGNNPGASRLFGNALPKTSDLARDSTRRKRDVVKDVSGNSNSNGKEEESHNEEEPVVSPREEKDISTIKVSKVVVKKRRTDRSRSPEKADGDEEDGDRDDKSNRTRDRDRKDSGRGRRDDRRSTRSSGDAKTVKTEKKSGKVAPHFTITLDGAPPMKPTPKVVRAVDEEEDDGYIMGGGTRAGVIVTGVPELKPVVLATLEDDAFPPEIQAAFDDLPAVGGGLTGTEAIRCRYWPKCTKEDCPFHHPKEICPYYPACKFGPTCLFIHVVAAGGRGRGRGRPAPYRGFRGGYRGRGGHSEAGAEVEAKEGEEGAEAGEGFAPRGRGGYRGRGRGRGGRGGPANSTKVYDASGVVCHFDTFCTAIGCPYQHPVRDSNEQNFLASSELSTKPAKSVASPGPEVPIVAKSEDASS